QCRARWILMRRRYVHELRVRRGRDSLRDVDPRVVDWHGRETRTTRDQRAARVEIPRLLDPHRIAWIQEKLKEQLRLLVRSRCDDHLLRRTAHAARCRRVVGNRFSQTAKPSRLTV